MNQEELGLARHKGGGGGGGGGGGLVVVVVIIVIVDQVWNRIGKELQSVLAFSRAFSDASRQYYLAWRDRYRYLIFWRQTK